MPNITDSSQKIYQFAKETNLLITYGLCFLLFSIILYLSSGLFELELFGTKVLTFTSRNLNHFSLISIASAAILILVGLTKKVISKQKNKEPNFEKRPFSSISIKLIRYGMLLLVISLVVAILHYANMKSEMSSFSSGESSSGIGLSILSFIGNATKYLSGIALFVGLILISKDIFTTKTIGSQE